MDAVADDVFGAAEYGHCSKAYRFDTIDYGNRREVEKTPRYTLVYSLRPLPPGAFQQMADSVMAVERKKAQDKSLMGRFGRWVRSDRNHQLEWPIWDIDWRLPDRIREKLGQDLVGILDMAGPVEMVVASDDPSQDILAACQVSAEDITDTKDWFTFLGLQR